MGTDQADTMTGRQDATDVMRGGGGNDTLRAFGGNDRLIGQAGDDTQSGGEADDTYVLDDRAGSDRIPEGGESGGIDTIDFSAVTHATKAELSQGRAGGWRGRLPVIEFPSTTVIESFRGGAGDDEAWGNSVRNRLYGNAGNDELYGRNGSDFLSGGPGDHDYLSGDEGNDTQDGGGGVDHYIFQLDSWGNDTIIDSAPSVLQFLSNGRRPTQALTINLVSSPGAPEVVNANGTGRVNWSGNAVTNVYNIRNSSDTIVGSPASNDIASVGTRSVEGGDSDYVSTGARDDQIIVVDGDGGDEVDCGEDGPGVTDNDTVRLDPGDTVINCETLIR